MGTKLFDRNATKLTISEFYENFVGEKYNLNPAYQRGNAVWSEDKKSFLIDSVLKNYPMPAIFLRPIVDNQTGKTTYDVVDGKQRLTAIIDFIENRINLTDYFAEDDFFGGEAPDEALKIAGLPFDEIKKQDKLFSDYVRQFWTYTISVEYLYDEDNDFIKTVFDRLNRNGEPLTDQELRNAKYSETLLLRTIKNLAKNEFWKGKLLRLKSSRMEDVAFVSELFFIVVKNQLLDSTPKTMESLYDEYSNKSKEKEVKDAKKRFDDLTSAISAANIPFNSLKRLCWTTHLYSLFGLVTLAKNKSPINWKKVVDFYTIYFSKDNRKGVDSRIKQYKEASSSRTNSLDQRKKRLVALAEYCGVSVSL